MAVRLGVLPRSLPPIPAGLNSFFRFVAVRLLASLVVIALGGRSDTCFAADPRDPGAAIRAALDTTDYRTVGSIRTPSGRPPTST